MKNECKACRKCKGRYCTTSVTLFSILQEEQLKEVTDLIVQRRYKKGQMIFFEGDVSDELFVITSGKIKVYKYTKEGKEQIMYILSEGDFIGDLSLLKKKEFKFNAEALVDTHICVLKKADFDKILIENPEISLNILEVLHDRIIKLENTVKNLGTKDIEERLANLLLTFIKDFGKPIGGEIELEIPLSREDLANFIGVTRETISRKLSNMQNAGVIELVGNKKIIIKDINYLESLV